MHISALTEKIKQNCEMVLSLLQQTKIGKKNRNANERLTTEVDLLSSNHVHDAD